MIFFAYDFRGERLNLTPLYKDEIPGRIRSQLERNLASRKSNLIPKNARSGVKKLVRGMWIEIAFLLPLFSY